MTTEWMRVMLEEIARKRDEAAQAREELARRGIAPTPETTGAARSRAPA